MYHAVILEKARFVQLAACLFPGFDDIIQEFYDTAEELRGLKSLEVGYCFHLDGFAQFLELEVGVPNRWCLDVEATPFCE